MQYCAPRKKNEQTYPRRTRCDAQASPAGALVAAAPPLIVYAFLMDYYIAGLTAGATKG
jgi:ABC-type glycerol-3-phosphate transport system permease component